MMDFPDTQNNVEKAILHAMPYFSLELTQSPLLCLAQVVLSPCTAGATIRIAGSKQVQVCRIAGSKQV
jgi:hypothetical protein